MQAVLCPSVSSLSLYLRNLPCSGHTQATGHSLATPLSLHEKDSQCFDSRSPKLGFSLPRELLNYITHNLQGTIPTPHMRKTKLCNKQDAADRFLRLYLTLPRSWTVGVTLRFYMSLGLFTFWL